MEYKFISNSVNDTYMFASKLAKLLRAGDVIVASGDLGAGKTAFAKGIGLGLDIKETIISPTFNIVRCYFNGILPFYHIDAYRLEGNTFPIGLDEYLEGDGVCLVEWGEYIKEIIPSIHLNLDIKIIDDNTREYVFSSDDLRYIELMENLKHEI